MSLNRRGLFCRKTSPADTPPSQTFVSLFTASQTVSQCKLSLPKSNNSSSYPPPSPAAKTTAGWGYNGALGSSVQNEQDRAEADQATRRVSQLEAVAMAFLSCWLRISRVRDSRSRSWQVLQTSTGSYSCWSGMGSFR